MSDGPRNYDNGGWLTPGVQVITNHYDAAEAIDAGRLYIQRVYGPEQVLSPEQTAALRNRIEEQ